VPFPATRSCMEMERAVSLELAGSQELVSLNYSRSGVFIAATPRPAKEAAIWAGRPNSVTILHILSRNQLRSLRHQAALKLAQMIIITPHEAHRHPYHFIRNV